MEGGAAGQASGDVYSWNGEELGIHRDTVRRYIDAESPPARRTPAIPPAPASDTIAD